jgi:hypothetical protein
MMSLEVQIRKSDDVKDSDQVLQTVIDYSCDENKNWKKLKRA